MVLAEDAFAYRRHREARQAVIVGLTVALFGAMLGLVFGVTLGTVRGPEAWIIALCVAVTGGLLLLLVLIPAIATDMIAGILSVYFVFHLNAGSIVAYSEAGDLVRTLPYVTWFFPLVTFQRFTNFEFHGKKIAVLVGLGPAPFIGYVAAHLADTFVLVDFDALVTFSVSFGSFVLLVGYYARHRDAEILRSARVEQAEHIAKVLQTNEERFRLLGRATNDLIWDADLASGRIWWNDALSDIFGYDPTRLGNAMNAWERWVHPDDRDRVMASMQSALAGNDSNWNCDYRFVCADGRVLEVVDRGLILRNEAGAPIRMIGSMTDVTQLRELEMRLRQSQKMEAVGQLTGGIAHDFNNMLTIILGNAEILEDMLADDPKARRLAETTILAAERGATLTSRLLSFARRQALEPKLVDPAELLNGMDALIDLSIAEDIEIAVHVADDIWPIEVDPGQLENAILNLVINARDAMPGGGRLTIEASNVTPESDGGGEGARYVMIAVSDIGTGMSPDVRDRAFEPFFTTKDTSKGSGLGLSMVWGFVQQSNGQAQIMSEPGKGTCVKLYFPAADRMPAHDPKKPAVASPRGGAERILVVEDDEMVRKNAVSQLARLGYDVQQAASPAQALSIMDEGARFDLLFTDVVMPGGMNGRQLADAALQRQPALKVLFTSGYSEDAIIHGGRLDAGVSLLGKPYRQHDLAVKIRHMFDS